MKNTAIELLNEVLEGNYTEYEISPELRDKIEAYLYGIVEINYIIYSINYNTYKVEGSDGVTYYQGSLSDCQSYLEKKSTNWKK